MLSKPLIIAALAMSAASGLAQTQDPNEGNPFGVAPSAQAFEAYPRWIPRMKEIGVRWIRTGVVRVHSGPGKWDWAKVDAFGETVKREQMSVIGVLMHPTPWIKKEIPNYEAEAAKAWKEYVSGMTGRLKGTVNYWEVWNEPQNFFFKDNAEAYGKHSALAYAAAKAAAPGCQVGIGVASVDVNYLARAIRAGARGHFDFITVHPYETMGQIDKIGNGSYLGIVKNIRNMLASVAPESANVPIWFTEIGAGVPKYMSPDRQARSLVKAFVMALAQGVVCVNWFEAEEHGEGFGLTDKQGNPTPAYHAMKNLVGSLGEKPRYVGWMDIGKDLMAFCFDGGSGPVLAVWGPAHSTQEVRFDFDAEVIDPITAEPARVVKVNEPLAVTGAPILISKVSPAIALAAEQNRSRPFPWNGDYSNAREVSFEFGNPNIEKGLHKLGEEGVAVTVFGGPAGDMSSPAGASFAVDPNFIAYSPSKVRITVTARRVDQAKEASFSLKYEAPSGFKNAAPCVLPGKDEWTAHTWELTDAAFAGKWVYNFSLVPAKGSQYYIRSVTVSKP